jgi:cyclic beta-1,2-glucan synthetase
MAQDLIRRLMPGAPAALCQILDGSRGAVEPPIRAEIFGPQRFAQHGRSLGQTHRATLVGARKAAFFPRLRDNVAVLREAHGYIGAQAATGYHISPAAEWLLDNFHLIEAQLDEVRAGLPRRYFRALPVLQDKPLAGLPRVYGVAWAFVAHTDGAFDEALLVQFLVAYQDTRELTLGELWALPTTLRVVLIESLRRLAERVATDKAAREVANRVCDQIERYTLLTLDALLAALNRRGVGRVFLTQMAQRLQDRSAPAHAAASTWQREWLARALPDLADAVGQQSADQTADNLSVSNAVSSLREIGDADWSVIIARTSTLMRLMLSAPLFEAEAAVTRDRTLHAIERLALGSGHSEVAVAQALLQRMHQSTPPPHLPVGPVGPVEHNEAAGSAAPALPALSASPAAETSAEYWLLGPGRPALAAALGLHERWHTVLQRQARRLALPAYLGALAVGTLGLVAALALHHTFGPAGQAGPITLTGGLFDSWVGALLMLWPASEAVVAVINRLVSESVRPHHLPRLALVDGIPIDHRVMVVIPAMLTSATQTTALVRRLHLHYLANPEPQAQFALLTDWADADAPEALNDDSLLDDALAQLAELNTRHPPAIGLLPRFILLHRGRSFCKTEQRWIGWERKRGKLEQLVAALADPVNSAFLDLGALSRRAEATRYIVTLDSDTELPPGRLRELVGVAAHPHNQPRLDASGRNVVQGYGILQPRVVTPLPALADFTRFQGLFGGQCGIDPYSAATSEVYQDLFGEGSFTGKGLLNVAAVHAVLAGRLPEGQVLSHDLLEGSIARCAAVTDITVIEEAPFHADVAAQRLHRWTRGDWQLLPLLLRAGRYGLRAVNRWKLFDNLRRSGVAPVSVALLVWALAGATVTPLAALLLVLAAFSAGPLMGAVAGLSPSRDDLAKQYFYHRAGAELGRAVGGGLWALQQLLAQAAMNTDAILRTLWRLTISRRHLLQWTTAATAAQQAQARAAGGLPTALRQHWRTPLAAALLLAALLAGGTPYALAATALCLLWASAPLGSWWVSLPRRMRRDAALPVAEQAVLEAVARDTWRFFERCVGAADHHLPPDNLQVLPNDMVAHRTSPTNIGLYLLSAACARSFGWIGTQELLQRLEATLATLDGMQRHRGHFLNWYDTQTAAPLLPMYVSTVDSGNLCGHLLAVAQACLELAAAPFDGAAGQRALRVSRARLAPLLAQRRELPPEQRLQLQDRLADHRAIRRSAALDEAARNPVGSQGVTQAHIAVLRLQDLAARCEALADQAEFGFLYHRQRHLLHIGWRVAEQQLDAGFYDLLASESRLTSLFAIAKGDVPVRHWAALGRPFFGVGALAGLRSWSGSMFEYLMPTLVLAEPPGSVLNEACHAALCEQIEFTAARHLPWGISESAYAGADHTLAYQYAPQGVPRLALRRTPTAELVLAPYASALALMIAPHRASLNLDALSALGAHGRYGFIEALDFTPGRQIGGEAFAPVATFMAHHQGMSIVAVANLLLGGPAQRWGMANAQLAAVASLLHERPPREVPVLRATPAAAPLQRSQRSTPGLLREVLPGASAVEPTHLLGNGRYSVSLRANGAGWSRWGATGITRWRDDALRDAMGSFFYLRWANPAERRSASAAAGHSWIGRSERRSANKARADSAPVVSLTQHPAPDPAAQYQSLFHADRVCFDAKWPGVQAHTTVWVSPEDDIEFRQVELHNLGEQVLDIELISAFELTLSDDRADESHPSFMNLFVRAAWQPEHQALVFDRTPRLPTEPALRAAHFLTDSDPQVVGLRIQTDRQRWLGRNRAASQPLALFDLPPTAAADAAPSTDNSNPLQAGCLPLATGLDPVCALAVRLRIAAHGKVKLTFATAASDNPTTLHAVIDKYRQASAVQRASLMSATLTAIRLRTLRLGPDNFAAIQSLTTALALSLTRPRAEPARAMDNPRAIDLAAATAAQPAAAEHCDRRLLWRFGISGDRPLLLVNASGIQGLGLLRTLAQALRLWAWGGVGCDLVVVNAEPASYLMALQREIAELRDRHLADSAAEGHHAGNSGRIPTGFFLLRADDLSGAELSTLQALARLRIFADGRPLLHHVQAWTERHEQALEDRQLGSSAELALASYAATVVPAALGEFDAASGEFRFDVSAALRPTRPWINVLANPGFGSQWSEAGGGCTWAVNSRLNQLTAWSNDPVADPPSEWLLLQDLKTLQLWNLAPGALGDDHLTYRVAHGQGSSSMAHRRGDVDILVTVCVDPLTAVKQMRVRLINHGPRPLQLRLAALAEWMMGSQRSDRNTVQTAAYHQRLPGSGNLGHEGGRAAPRLLALLATQRDHSAGFGDGTAFLALASTGGSAELADDWTCDRRECFDARGGLVLPDHFGQRSGPGLDPIAALSTRLLLAPGESTERVFLLGYATSPDAARQLAAEAATVPAAQRLAQVQASWDALLGATSVTTPDPLFDVMVNRWLLYQTVSCRLWAKAAFYQAGGATGFRDQLQDSMALAWAAPQMLREQILLCASRQFPEGDVQHWWHNPKGNGVRTHFSDDLLWLAHACVHHLRCTGDASLMDEVVPFIEAGPIPDGAEDAYTTPSVSAQSASVYEHAARAIDRSLRVGVHGLPLMGSGDWNDGMNRVGHGGRGESVWLAWFLCRLVADFAPLARARGDGPRAQHWEDAAVGWQAALMGPAWDGQWFKRAFFDDGQALGSHTGTEARIDLIAQAWSVLSGVAPPALQRIAMASVQDHLVDADAGLIRLLDPPLALAQPSAGYIQAYPPGVRENGGQYSHAAVWALMAQAQLHVQARSQAQVPGQPPAALASSDDASADAAYRSFTWLSPAHRASHPTQGPAYGIEPYAVAGDIYSQPPYVGRGGWSWYTGAAAWLHRAAIESIFGLQLQAQSLQFTPCLPSHWPRAELRLQRDGKQLHFILARGISLAAIQASVPADALLLAPDQALDWTQLSVGTHCFLVPLLEAAPTSPD